MKRPSTAILLAILLELLLGLALVLVVFFAYYYVVANTPVFTTMSILENAFGADRFWMALYLGSDIGLFVMIMGIFLELTLLLLRLVVKTAVKPVELLSGKDFSRLKDLVKKVSLATLFKALRINSTKRALIAYVVLLVVVFGSGWLGKAVLKGSDALIYRAHEMINLESDEQQIDFATEVDNDEVYDLVIETNVGVVHIYAGSDAADTGATVYFLYDTQEQKDNYTLVNDTIDNTLSIHFNEQISTYERYVDPVMPSVEIYLPFDLKIGTISVTIRNDGYLTTQFLDFTALEGDFTHSQVSITANKLNVGSIEIAADQSQIALNVDEPDSLTLDLTASEADLKLGTVAGTIAITATGSDVFLYSTTAEALEIYATACKTELREVYADSVHIVVTTCELLYYNGTPHTFAAFEIIETQSSVSVKGVPYDPDRLS